VCKVIVKKAVCSFSGAPCRQDRSYDKDVITRLFSYWPYIKVSVVISPRLPPRADNRRSTLIYGPIWKQPCDNL